MDKIIRVLFCAYSVSLHLWTKNAYHRIVCMSDNEQEEHKSRNKVENK